MINKESKQFIFISSPDKCPQHENHYAQNIILSAMSDGITDPKKLREISGLRSLADVYKTLDRLSIREEYHKVLIDNGVDLSYVVSSLKKVCDETQSDSIKLNALKTFLSSLGLDKYQDDYVTSKSWEETVMKLSGEKFEEKQGEYVVNVPKIPEEAATIRREEDAYGKMIYE